VSWRVIIRPNAEADLQEARSWYESRRAGLGDELLDEIRRAVRFLEAEPNAIRFITGTFAGCSHVVSLTNFSIASKATASLSFAFCTRNGSISGSLKIKNYAPTCRAGVQS
jgi:hypothetical protein